MNPLSQLALAAVALWAGVWAWFRVERWLAERRLASLHREIVDVGRRSGFADSELETSCYRCGKPAVGPYCERCR